MMPAHASAGVPNVAGRTLASKIWSLLAVDAPTIARALPVITDWWNTPSAFQAHGPPPKLQYGPLFAHTGSQTSPWFCAQIVASGAGATITLSKSAAARYE